MVKKIIVCATAFAFLAGFAAFSSAADKGPETLTLQSTVDKSDKPKPATFPHKKHQDAGLACGECHHGKGADGKQAAYTDGMKIEKCESCHNKAAGMPKEAATFKDAAHTNCKGCHQKGGKGPTKCPECHK
ncbi:MAG: cytochrome c3 family protein [Deltaproteobacteria bacterium]|nr:cytochrome c3 family protein [Deltaproteobacteria bacterium]